MGDGGCLRSMEEALRWEIGMKFHLADEMHLRRYYMESMQYQQKTRTVRRNERERETERQREREKERERERERERKTGRVLTDIEDCSRERERKRERKTPRHTDMD